MSFVILLAGREQRPVGVGPVSRSRRRGAFLAVAAFAFLVAVCDPARADERHDYVLHCAGCHKPDGSGSQVVPSLADMGRVFAARGGREYLIRVPGVAQAPLSDEKLASLLNWLLAEHAGALALPYTAAEVRRHRAQPLRDPLAARKAILDRAAAASPSE